MRQLNSIKLAERMEPIERTQQAELRSLAVNCADQIHKALDEDTRGRLIAALRVINEAWYSYEEGVECRVLRH